MPNYRRERDAAIDAVRRAARLTRAVQDQISAEVVEKRDRSPVTVADFGSQALVCSALREAFPEDPIVAEEDSAVLREPENAAVLEQVVQHVADVAGAGDADLACRWIDYGGADEYSDRFWTLDPIDGTKGFLRGEQYAVALALIVDGEVTVAALACPNLPAVGTLEGPEAPVRRGVIYAAIRGEGAMALPLQEGGVEREVHVSTTSDANQARFCESVESGHSSHDDSAAVADELGITADPVRVDSQCKYAIVARGEADIYLRLPTRPGYVERIWDHAAGFLVVTEAGGRVTDVAGRDLAFNRGPGLEANRGVIVTNGALHDDVLAALATVGVSEG